MASVNKVILVGHLGRDPEIRYLPNGDAVTNCTIATSDTWKDKNTGEKKEATEWHRLVFYRRLAEVVAEYVVKGSQIYVEGQIKTRKWQDKQGQDRYTAEIICDKMQMLGSRQERDGDPHQAPEPKEPRRQQPAGGEAGNGLDEDDIPF